MKKEEKDLLRLKSILDEIDVPFFLIEGTLLGAMRDGTLIEYDKDFDIGIDIDVDNKEMRDDIIYEISKRGLKVTLLGPEPNPNKPSYWFLIEGLKWQTALLPYIVVNEWAVFATIPIKFPVKLFQNLLPFQFLGTEFLVPNPPEDYLDLNYGKTWKMSAQRRYIIKGSDPIEVYKFPVLEKVYLKCKKDGTLIEPLESIGPQLD